MNSTLTTPHLLLKALEEQDRETMIRLLGDREIGKTYMLPVFQSKQQADAYFDRLVVLCQTRFVFGIYLPDGELIGMLNECGCTEDEIELGYFISTAHQGRGYATEALQAAIQECFLCGFRHVVAGFFEENPASRRVMEKCGMHPLNRESVISYQGRDHCCLYMGVDRE